MSASVRVILLVPDAALQTQITDRLRGELGQVPWSFVPVDSGDRLLAEIRMQPAHLVIAAQEFPGGVLRDLSERILAQTGDLPILGLKKAGGKDIRGVTAVDIPILNWGQVLAVVASSLSEDLKIRYGLEQLNTEIRKRLLQWGRKYSDQPTAESEVSILQFPPSIHLGESKTHFKASAVGPSETHLQLRLLERKSPLWAEFAVLILTGGGALAARHFWDDEALFSLSRILTGVFAMAVLAFFCLRLAERIGLRASSTT